MENPASTSGLYQALSCQLLLNSSPRKTRMTTMTAFRMALSILFVLAYCDPRAAPNAYITSTYPDGVIVIDTATDQQLETIRVGASPWGIVITHDGSRAYVANSKANSVSVIDLIADRTPVVATIPLQCNPQGLAISPDDTTVYADCGGNHLILPIDTATNTLLGDPIPTYKNYYFSENLALSPDASIAYIGVYDVGPGGRLVGGVSFVDTATKSLEDFLPVTGGVRNLAISPDGSKLYAVEGEYGAQGGLSIIDLPTKTVTAQIPLGIFPTGISISADGKTAYVVNSSIPVPANGPGKVSVIDLESQTVTSTIDTRYGSFASDLTPDGSKLYVTNINSGSISVIDTLTNTAINRIVLNAVTTRRPAPFGIAIPKTWPEKATNHSISALTIKKANYNQKTKVWNIAGNVRFAKKIRGQVNQILELSNAITGEMLKPNLGIIHGKSASAFGTWNFKGGVVSSAAVCAIKVRDPISKVSSTYKMKPIPAYCR